MKRWIAIVLLGLSGFATPLLAAETAVAVIEFARLQSEAPQALRARERIADEFALRQGRIEEQAAQIEALEQELESGADLDETELRSLERDIRSRSLRLQNAREELQNDRRLRASEESDRLRRIVGEVIAEVAAREGVAVVLESGVVTWAAAESDITEKVLLRLQELDKGAR